ncbi:MAG: Gfo/Idh/MocA family oxidoreductase [Pirellulales bacterium]|nr:Gfo/Idh/MocA family oxidoreductase [Pirellulales bacterium]
MKVGIAGIGFMGMVHYLTYQKIDGVDVVALAEPNEKRLRGDWTDIQGNFGPRGEMMDLSGVARYPDAVAMIDKADIDFVDICLPPSLHAPVAIHGLGSGKHVFCEKPIALTAEDANAMVATAEQGGKRLLIGHVLPYFPEYRKAYEIIQSGMYGPAIGGHFKRVISDPAWLADFWNPDLMGGPMLDLHVHDAHYVRLLFGMPKAVTTQGRMRGDLAEYWNTHFVFEEKNLVVSATSGVIHQQGRSFLHGFEIHLEKATLAFEFAVIGGQPELLLPLTILADDGSVERPVLDGGDPMSAFEAELTEVLRSIGSGEPSPILAGDLARDAVTICHHQTQSIATGNRVACGPG